MTDEHPDDLDSPWKEALEQALPEFLALFFPEAHAGIDWSRGYRFRDKELQQVVRDAELGRRYADKLAGIFRVFRGQCTHFATAGHFPGTVHPCLRSRFCRGAAGVIRCS